MNKIFLSLLFLLIFLNSYSQIAEKDFPEAENLEKFYADNIDSIKPLEKNSFLTYSHNDKFRAIHLTGFNEQIYLVDLVYLDDFSGYVRFKADFSDKVLFEAKSDGSGNSLFYLTIDKETGKRGFPTEEEVKNME